MKKQVVIMFSVALASFLLGTLFSMGSTALGIIPNPFDNLRNTFELQAKVVRFTQSNEINVTSRDEYQLFKDVATFVWIPNNSKNNSILAIYSYCEYRSESPLPTVWEWSDVLGWQLLFNIKVNEFQGGEDSPRIGESATSQQDWEQKGLSQWQQVAFLVQPNPIWINPNQENYTLTFQTCHRASASISTYVRNINIILTVIDG